MKEIDIEAEKAKYQSAIRAIAKRYGVRKLARDYRLGGSFQHCLYRPDLVKLDRMIKTYEKIRNA